MRTPYETMFLLPPTVNEEQIQAVIGRLKEVVEKKHGEVTNLEKMGIRKTAYTVNKMNTAYYILAQYQGTGETIHEVERMLRNSDEVLKFMSTKITSKPRMIPPSNSKLRKAAAKAKPEPKPFVAETPTETVKVAPETSTPISASGTGTQE